MSMIGPGAPGRRSDQVGETVASFPTYEAAQKAVSSLIAGEVPARHIAIVGQGLRSIERVTGRLGYATAARSGAINGMLLGLFFSAILVLGAPTVPIQAFVGVIFVGIAIGMLLSIVTYSFVRRRRDFASVMQVAADHYEVAVERDSVATARQVLGRAADAPAPAAARVPVSAPADTERPVGSDRPLPEDAPPPRYGERIPPRPEEPPRYGERIGAPEQPAEPAPDAPDRPADASAIPADAPERPADDSAGTSPRAS